MFYLLNIKNSIKNNPYKLALKNLITEIKNMDFSLFESIDNFGDTSLDLLASWAINNTDEVTVKSLEKKLNAICNEFSVEELYFMYLSSLSDILADELMLEKIKNHGIDIESDFKDYNKSIAKSRLKCLIGTFCLFAITINNNLLERRVDSLNIEDNYILTSINKSLKKGRYSIFKGIKGVPILINEKEATILDALYKRLKSDNYSEEIIEYSSIMCSYKFLEVLISKYCFGNKLDKYIDITEFKGNDLYQLSKINLFLSPVSVFTSRKIIPPEDGVILLLEEHPEIESIYISECSRFNYRIIYGVIRYKNGLESPISLRINHSAIVTLSCNNVVDVLTAMIDYYKIPDEALKCLGPVPVAPKYKVLSGKYWLFRKTGYETDYEKEQKKSGKKVKHEYTSKSDTYIRKINGKASDEAMTLAKILKIDLDDGTTLRKEKDRKYFREIEYIIDKLV